MTLLVADVGGTNTRIALIRPGGPISQSERYQNNGFASFYELLSRYGETHDLSGLTGCCVAVAGPVTAGAARLTNLDWGFDTATIATALPLRPTGSVHLVNDLVALGFSLSGLSPDQLTQIKPSNEPGPSNSQALVAGVGTGFNVCAVKSTPAGPVVTEAELGHACLPACVSNTLLKECGSEAAQFTTYEHLLSGAGLSRLFRLVSGGGEQTGPQILAAYDPARRDASARAVELMARMLGVIARELVFQYLPYGGIHFAGGVARGILGSPASDMFLEALNGSATAPGPFEQHIARVPIRVINDDAAALIGAAQYAQTL